MLEASGYKEKNTSERQHVARASGEAPKTARDAQMFGIDARHHREQREHHERQQHMHHADLHAGHVDSSFTGVS